MIVRLLHDVDFVIKNDLRCEEVIQHDDIEYKRRKICEYVKTGKHPQVETKDKMINKKVKRKLTVGDLRLQDDLNRLTTADTVRDEINQI